MGKADETLLRGPGRRATWFCTPLDAVRIIGQLTTAGEDKIAAAAQALAA